MTKTIYVITAYAFNHEKKELDERFLQSSNNYVYYLIDHNVPKALVDKKVILEKDLDPFLHVAGAKYFAEWSFLLNEAKNSFCTYPFFMISSRFYQKNRWLKNDLNAEWERLFTYLETYKYGMLPSYDRPLRWIDLKWKKKVLPSYNTYFFFPFTHKTFPLVEEILGVSIPQDYRYFSDLFCNYIGFNTREELLAYVAFYRPLIDHFFDAEYQPKRNFLDYVIPTGHFRNEKPFTFLLEYLSHLFFFKEKKNFFALHYDGYYDIDEFHTKKHKILSFELSWQERLQRMSTWQLRKLKTESFLTKLNNVMRKC